MKKYIFLIILVLLTTFVFALPEPNEVNISKLVITKYDGVEAETYLPEINENELCLYHKADTNANSIEELKQLIQEAQEQIPNWEVEVSYKISDLVKYNNLTYKVLQVHTSQSDWIPPNVPALFVEYAFQDLGEVPQWVQPTGGHDAYNIADRVWFEVNGNKLIYESLINSNVWSPTVYPAGWKEIGMISETEVYGNETITGINELGNSLVLPRNIEDGLSTYCINVTKKIQIGTNTIIAEVINSTYYIYDTDTFDTESGFIVEIYDCDENKYLAPDTNWISTNPNSSKIEFYPNISGINYPLDCVQYKVNTLETTKNKKDYGFKTEIETWKLSFDTFESKNNITNKTIWQVEEGIWEQIWDSVLGWFGVQDQEYMWIRYEGNIIDLDPELSTVLTSSSKVKELNQTTTTTNGLRLSDIPKTYYWNINWAGSYPDTNSAEMNDKILPSTAVYTNTNWAGVQASPIWNIDFGETKDYSTIRVFYLIQAGVGSTGMSNILVESSSDNSTWTLIGNFTQPGNWSAGTDGKYWTNYLPISGSSRYLRATLTRATQWLFIGEIEVNNINGVNQLFTPYSNGDYTSFVWQNDTSQYWQSNLSIADSNGSWDTYDLCQADDNCMVYWSMDGDGTDLKAGNDLTVLAGTINSTGISSGALECHTDTCGLDRAVTVTNFVDGVGAFSIWINMRVDGSKTQYLYSISGGGTTNAYISAGNNDFSYIKWGGVIADGIQNEPITNTGWRHIAITTNGTRANSYLDGKYYGTTIYNSDLSGNFTRTDIGQHYGGSEINGSIDEFLIFNRDLTTSEVEELYKAGLSQHANTNVSIQTRTGSSYNLSDDGLVGLWGLNGNANDELGVNNGTFEGGMGTTDASGVVGEGGEFDGVNDYVNGSSINLPTTFSTSLWIKAEQDDTGTSRYIIDNYDGSELLALAGSTTNNRLVYFASNSLAGYSDGINWDDGNWHHLFYSTDGSGFTLYFDGVNQTITGTVNPGDHDAVGFNLGKSSIAANSYNFNGSIDEVRIYNRSLSADEVQNLYELGSYHIEDWSDWSTETIAEDGIPTNSETQGKFFQYIGILETNNTDVSSYVLNHSIGIGEEIITNVPPYFTYIPDNQSIECENETLNVNFTAFDVDDNFDSYTVNNSNFSINSSGWLSIVSAMVGNYILNITINDTDGAENSTLYNVNITDLTAPKWYNNLTNITSGSAEQDVYFNITFSDGCSEGYYIFSWYNGSNWLNDTAESWINNTPIEVIKTIPNGINYINWTWYVNDSYGNNNQTGIFRKNIEAVPSISNIYPVNGETYLELIDYSTFDVLFSNGGDSCWYSLNNGLTNSTPIDTSDDLGSYQFNDVNFIEGENTITIWCNNTEDGQNFGTSTFTIDLLPELSIISPTNNSEQNIIFNLEISCNDVIGISEIWYNWKGTNYTYTTSLDLSSSTGNYNITAYCNDTYGSIVTKTHYFEVISGSGNVTSTITGTANICRYKKLGYYNEKLPFMKENNCI